jgi:TRAP-type mannitol/chloroaromatic compound transport system permease small subunit
MPEAMLDILGQSLHFIGWAFLPALLLPAIILFTGRLIAFSETLISLIDTISIFIGEVVKWFLPLMVLSIVLAVFALSIYGVSSIWWDESAIYLHALGICLGVAPTYLAGQHVKVDIFYDRMKADTKALIEICGFYALMVPVCLAVIWRSQSFVAFAWQSFEGSTNSGGIQGVFILKTALSAMFILVLIQGLSVAMRAAIQLRSKKVLETPNHASFPFIEGNIHKSDPL